LTIPSHKRAEVIIGKEGMLCVCVCGGISAAILSPSVATSVDYQQNNRKREIESGKYN